MAHVTNSSLNVRGYHFSNVNTEKARSDIIEVSLNCSWVLIIPLRTGCQLKATSSAVFIIKNRPEHSLQKLPSPTCNSYEVREWST